jgi:AraC-like DNA-binding protein
MLYVIAGQVRLQWLGESYLFNPHSLILLHPNTPHQVVGLSADSSFWFVELDMADGSLFPGLEKCIVWNRQQSSMNPVYTEEPAYGVTLNLLTAAICSGKMDVSRFSKEIALLDIQKLLLIINALLTQKSYAAPPSPSVDPSASHEAVLFLMRYMETEYSRSIPLKTMSELTHFNSSYLIRIFKKYTRVTPAQYLQSLRLNAAVSYLSTTDLTVEQIAQCCGYQSIHYFSQAFKRKLGVSPASWRKRNDHKNGVQTAENDQSNVPIIWHQR